MTDFISAMLRCQSVNSYDSVTVEKSVMRS